MNKSLIAAVLFAKNADPKRENFMNDPRLPYPPFRTSHNNPIDSGTANPEPEPEQEPEIPLSLHDSIFNLIPYAIREREIFRAKITLLTLIAKENEKVHKWLDEEGVPRYLISEFQVESDELPLLSRIKYFCHTEVAK